jgi:tetrapyrrole methylase family protein/MazG family protein/ATP diphosphatase
VPVHFPALLEALKLTKRAAKVGFDWQDTEQVFEKLSEEVDELKAAIASNDEKNIAEEIGDLLFVLVNVARKLDIEPETALKRCNRKFRERFRFIEKELGSSGKKLEESGLNEMDALWNAAKLESN